MSDAIYEQLPKTHLKTFMTKYVEKLLEQIHHISKDALKKEDTIPLSYYYLAFDALLILPDFDTKIHGVFHREEKAWIEVIENAKASGEIVSTIDSRHLAILFISAIDGLGMHLILENRLNQLSEEIMSVWTSLYKLIKA